MSVCKVPRRSILHNDPHVEIIDDFLEKHECIHFINIANSRLKQALVTEETGQAVSLNRSSKNCWITHDYDIITLNIAKKISKYVNIPLRNAESFQIIYYNLNGEYRPHYDSWLHDGSIRSTNSMKFGGQRMITALCYLNNVPSGGNTFFSKLNINVKPRLGRILLFNNVYKNTNIQHPLSKHASCPVEKGEKWAFNLWFREYDMMRIIYNPTIKNNQINNPKKSETCEDYSHLNKY